MSGMDMMVNAALKAVGFSRDQLDAVLIEGKQHLEIARQMAINIDERVGNLENQVSDIHSILKRIENKLNSTEIESTEIRS